jgi:hypothetical protein
LNAENVTLALPTPSLQCHKPDLPSQMASSSPAGKFSQAYACKCLNVQITSSTQVPSSSPEGTCDPAYESIFVEDEGIVIVRFFFDKIYWYRAHLLYLSDTSPDNGQNYNAPRTNTGYFTTLPIYRSDMPTLSAARIPCISNHLIGHSGQ